MNSLKFFILLILVFPLNALAVQGTCSWHGGVDCSAGMDWDGSAICYDGWRDSSELYSNTQMCQDTVHHCSLEEDMRIQKKYNITELRETMEKLAKQGDREWEKGNSQESAFIALDTIAAQDNLGTALSAAESECALVGEYEFYKQQQKIIENLNNIPVVNNNACAAYPNTHVDGEFCNCNDGFTPNSDGSVCVAIKRSKEVLPLVNIPQRDVEDKGSLSTENNQTLKVNLKQNSSGDIEYEHTATSSNDKNKEGTFLKKIKDWFSSIFSWF
jgi:hypothetical protein